MAIDPFTKKRLINTIEAHRKAQGTLPTLNDLIQSGFEESLIDRAEREKIIIKLYVTLTNGTVVRGYKAGTAHLQCP